MTYEYKPGEVPVPARRCVRCAAPLETEAGAGGTTTGWFQPSRLSSDTIWVFTSRGQPAGAVAERLRCPGCERRYALIR